VSRNQRPHQHIISHFGDESFQSITCTGIDNLTRTTKRQNTQITQNNTTQKWALVNSTADTLKKPRLRDRTDRAWFSCLVRHPARKRSGSIFTTPEPARGDPGSSSDNKVRTALKTEASVLMLMYDRWRQSCAIVSVYVCYDCPIDMRRIDHYVYHQPVVHGHRCSTLARESYSNVCGIKCALHWYM